MGEHATIVRFTSGGTMAGGVSKPPSLRSRTSIKTGRKAWANPCGIHGLASARRFNENSPILVQIELLVMAGAR